MGFAYSQCAPAISVSRELAPALRFFSSDIGSDLSKSGCSMVTENTFFYFVLLTLLSVILNALAARSHHRHDGHSRA